MKKRANPVSSSRRKSLSRKTRLQVECLEDRRLLSCNTISGYVYQDANNNGLFDTGESPIAGSVVELRNAAAVVVASSVSNSQGYYEFSTDQTIDTTPTTEQQLLIFTDGKTNSTQSLTAPQFDEELGQLTSVEIRIRGHITSEIKVENFDPSPAAIQATVAGKLTIAGPHLDSTVTTASDTQTFAAGAFDGSPDFSGAGGVSFAPKTVSGQTTTVITNPSELAAFIGTGTVTFTESAQSTSSANGGGNLAAMISSKGGAELELIYHYIPSNCLKPGAYTIVQTVQPAGLFDGMEARGGEVLSGSVGSDSISVILAETDLTNNTFAEVAAARLGGIVYNDANNNGVKDAGESGIGGVSVRLEGTNDTGAPVANTLTTASDGSYLFANLRPGSYDLRETQPNTFLDGADSIGNAGGNAADDYFAAITLAPGTSAADYNFGEIQSSSLAGFVYQDANNNGVKEGGESGLAGVSVRLSGTDDRGNAVDQTLPTDGAGAYRFSDLRPGTYVLSESQPGGGEGTVSVAGSALTGLLDGQDAVGSMGGEAGNDQLVNIPLSPGSNGQNYNFGEIQPAQISGSVFVDGNNNGNRDASESGLGGVTIGLLGIDDLGQDVALEMTTIANGEFQFANLRPGTYELAEKQPQGHLDGNDKAGTAGGSVSDDLIGEIALAVGQSGSGYQFAEIPPASLGGMVGVDANNNGKSDTGESGIAGATVTLSGIDDRGETVTRSELTDAAGRFRFADLRPGAYRVTEQQPPNYLDGKESAGNQGGSVADDQISDIDLGVGLAATDYYFGELQAASLSGFVFVDSNGSGQREPGEGGIPGVLVTLNGIDDLGKMVSRSTTTLGDGSYVFAGLRPGTYSISEAQPGGYDDGMDAAGSHGGLIENDRITNIRLGGGQQAVNYNFGERQRIIVKPKDIPLTISKFDFLGSTARRRRG